MKEEFTRKLQKIALMEMGEELQMKESELRVRADWSNKNNKGRQGSAHTHNVNLKDTHPADVVDLFNPIIIQDNNINAEGPVFLGQGIGEQLCAVAVGSSWIASLQVCPLENHDIARQCEGELIGNYEPPAPDFNKRMSVNALL